MNKYQSTKVFDGFSTTFRQWRAEGTHCKYLHSYNTSFKVWFEGPLDFRGWVFDYGGMKRAKYTIDGMSPRTWMDFMFDHTTIVSDDDPKLSIFKQMDIDGIIQLRILPNVGAERFAQYVFEKLDVFVQKETEDRVAVKRVEFFEHGKNSAIYERE